MKRFLTVPFTLECVMYPDSDSVSYVIIRDPDGKVSSVETTLIDAAGHLLEVLDEFVFTKKKVNNENEN